LFQLPPAVLVQVMVAARAEASVSTSAANANLKQWIEVTQAGPTLNFGEFIVLSIFTGGEMVVVQFESVVFERF
jgi:hypothetical protein